jgi:pyridoxal phosphate enzyme (YggS family)
MAITSTGSELKARLGLVRNSIAVAATRAGRNPSDVTLIAVSKTHPVSVLREGIQLGVGDFGENRVQEAESKINELGRNAARWHLIGHLQANKARKAVQLFDVIHSIDSSALVRRLDTLSNELGRDRLEVLIQLDLAGEMSKSGADMDELPEIVDTIRSSACLQLTGLMTLPPFFEDAEQTRPYFRRLREIRDRLSEQGAFGAGTGHLSMGMSHDFETAIEEGATMVRVGTALFGSRG